MRDRNRSSFFVVLCVLALCCPSILHANWTEQVSVAVGEDFTVALASNPTTGYSWTLVGLPVWLTQVDKTYVPDPEPAGWVGGGGTEHWTFRATATGSVALIFEYMQPWIGSPIKVHICEVAAKPLVDTQNIFVVTGQEFTIALASSPSTGYSWTLLGSLPTWLNQVRNTYIATHPDLIGGGGTEYWTFQATATGSVALIFEYMQSWIGTPIKICICQITATPPTGTQNISVVAGREFTIALASNPSTGYSWTLPGPVPSWLAPVDHSFVANRPDLIGGGGTEYWTFRASAAGSTTLTFQYVRPRGTPTKTRVCQVTATP